jgi:ubiquinone/menaquinone biosynthesis C-methylase UbiE
MGIYAREILPVLIEFAMTRPEIAQLRAAYVPMAAGVVLEVGVGSGVNLPFYSKNVERLYGLDPSQELLARARRRARDVRFPVQLIKGDASRLPIASASVDCVVMTWTLCSIAEPAAALREMRRVLKNQGALMFVEHGLGPDPGVQKWQNRCTPVWQHIAGGCHLNRDVDRLVREGGFSISSLESQYIPGPRIMTFMYAGRAIPT